MLAGNPLAVAVQNGVLWVSGTSSADAIAVSRSGTIYTICNGGWSTTRGGAIKSINLRSGAGDDSVRLDASVSVPAKISGNSGNDTLIGGSGADRIYGHAGNDFLDGGGGDDVLVGIGGGLRDSLRGGTGTDSFWLDAGGSENVGDASTTEHASNAVHRVGIFQSVRGVAISKEITGDKINLADPTSKHAGARWNNFASLPLFPAGGPGIDDVRQGALGDCYLHAPLAAMAARNPRRIRESICDLGDGTYAVQLFRGTTRLFYRVDADLPVYTFAAGVPVYAGLGNQNAVWAALIEKAFALHRTSRMSYESIGAGGWFDEAFAALGMSSRDRFAGEFSSPAALVDRIAAELSAGSAVTFGTRLIADDADSILVGGHAYTVIRITANRDGSKSVLVRNPWAIDGGNIPSGDAEDGYVTLTAQQLAAGMSAFSAARV